MTKRKTHEEFMNEFQDRGSQNLEIIGHYISYHTPIDVKCRKCGYTYDSLPHNLLKGTGCPVCSGRIALESVNNVYNANRDLIQTFASLSECCRELEKNIIYIFVTLVRQMLVEDKTIFIKVSILNSYNYL